MVASKPKETVALLEERIAKGGSDASESARRFHQRGQAGT